MNDLKTMSYDEIVAHAKSMHPNASVSLSSLGGHWMISIDTDIEVNEDLPDDFKGTPAWDLYMQFNSSYNNELHHWGDNNGHGWLPIEGIATMFNMNAKKNAIFKEYVNEKSLAVLGEPFDWDNATNETFTAYKAIREEANVICAEAMADEQAAFDAYWDTLTA